MRLQATARGRPLSTGAIRRVITNQQGVFEAPALLPDDYELKIEASGFAIAKQTLRLEVGQKLALDIALKIGSVAEGVKVTAGSEVLHTTDAQRRRSRRTNLHSRTTGSTAGC